MMIGYGFTGRTLLSRVSRVTTACQSLPSYHIARKSDGSGDGSRFPWRDGFEIDSRTNVDAETILETLSPLISEERKERIDLACRQRTFDVLPIIEDPYDWGNVAAVCRSADAMGVGAVHIIRENNTDKFKQSTRTSGGADKWLDIQLFDTTRECLHRAKENGFQVVATCLGKEAVRPGEIDWSKPTAIVFGNEMKGVSDEVVEMADGMCEIDIDGFVDSYNISVAAALMLWEARRVRLDKLGYHGNLTEKEIEILRAVFYLRNKGVFQQYASILLRQKPPEWQVHRGEWPDSDEE